MRDSAVGQQELLKQNTLYKRGDAAARLMQAAAFWKEERSGLSVDVPYEDGCSLCLDSNCDPRQFVCVTGVSYNF